MTLIKNHFPKLSMIVKVIDFNNLVRNTNSHIYIFYNNNGSERKVGYIAYLIENGVIKRAYYGKTKIEARESYEYHNRFEAVLITTNKENYCIIISNDNNINIGDHCLTPDGEIWECSDDDIDLSPCKKVLAQSKEIHKGLPLF